MSIKSHVHRSIVAELSFSAPDVDHEVRWHLLKLGDVILKGADEAPPKVTIFIPPTPVVEQAPPVLLLNKPSKRDKIKNESTLRSPLTPIAPALKLTFAAGTPTTPKLSQSGPGPKTPRVGIAPPQAKPIKPKETKAAPPPPAPVKVQRVDVYKLHKACGRKTMELIMADKHASIFLQPVDPIRDSAPNYFEVIREPMDLSTMRAKLDANKYKNIEELAADFRLMIANCKHYNSDGSYAFVEAQALEQVFNKRESLNIVSYCSVLNHPSELARMQRTIKTQLERESDLISKTKSEGKGNSDKAMGPPTIVPAPTPSTPSTPAPSRPSITLKLGGDKPKVKAIRPASPPAGSTPRPKKAKTNEDSPPPPYVDDGSHDLLQEVIAIENARDEKRTGSSLKISVGKRKRSSTTITDDGSNSEVHKRERHSPAASQSSTADSAPPKPKLILAPLKAKKPIEPSTPSAAATPVPPATPTPRPPSIAPSPAPSTKGKERETSQTASASVDAPSRAKRSSESAGTPVDVKKAKEVIKTLLRLPEAMIFQRPVDPELDGCPTYVVVCCGLLVLILSQLL